MQEGDLNKMANDPKRDGSGKGTQTNKGRGCSKASGKNKKQK